MNIALLIKGIKQLESRSSSGELAFLCLNGKSENHLRDLIAFNIACIKPKWSIEREKNRVDYSAQINSPICAHINYP